MKYNIYEINEENKLYSYRAKDHGDLLKEGLNLKENTGFENDVWCSIEKLKHYNEDGTLRLEYTEKGLIIHEDKEAIEKYKTEQKELQRVELIKSKIKEKYSIEDEISMIYKDDLDPKKVKYREFVKGVKDEISTEFI